MIKAIIFDLGGVVLFHRKLIISEILPRLFPDIPENTILELWQKYQSALFTGNISSKAMLEKIKQESNSEATVGEMLIQWQSYYEQQITGINTELLEIISNLKKYYKAYLFTDTIDVHDAANSKKNIYSHFDGLYKSHKIGKAKLEGKDAFVYVINDIGVKPEECLFIDDSEFNIKTAKKFGIKAILYKNNKQLKQAFAREELKII